MKSDRSVSMLAILGAAHAVSDGSAGWLIANCASRLSIAEVGTLTIIYNAFAFAVQPAVGLLLDRIRQPRRAVFDCLLNPNRNPGLDKRQIETLLAGSLGLTDMLWLGDGLVNDHTDGHVDNLARFVAPGVIAIPEATTDDDPNAAIYADAKARAKAFGLEVASMPSPGRIEAGGAIIPASYMNFLVGNAAVLVPLYDNHNDTAALDALRPFFQDREVVGLSSDAILAGGGSFHCTSQQMPAG